MRIKAVKTLGYILFLIVSCASNKKELIGEWYIKEILIKKEVTSHEFVNTSSFYYFFGPEFWFESKNSKVIFNKDGTILFENLDDNYVKREKLKFHFELESKESVTYLVLNVTQNKSLIKSFNNKIISLKLDSLKIALDDNFLLVLYKKKG